MLSKKQTTELKTQLDNRLLKLRDEIKHELQSLDNHEYNEAAGQVHDIGDNSLVDFLTDINLAAIDRHIQEVKNIEAALLKMSEGDYGRCSDCDAPIKHQRLEVQPTATRCIKCQAEHEKSHLN
ncbi:MAG: TraR/DksA family transcriptional regulator [Methylococcaceae bacterium]|nr:TraR/DksA family transcriptional regulator [Methylococcaceae bacterium]